MRNPFAGYGTTVRGERLVGRESELTLIGARLADGCGSVSVVGLPRVGKTSLVTECLRRIREDQPDRAVARLNAAAVPNGSVLLGAMLDETVLSVLTHRPEVEAELADIIALPVSSSYESYRRARRGFTRLRRLGIESVVAIDEFDAVRTYEGAGQTIQQLREILDERWRTGVSAVLISRRSLGAIEEQVADVSTLHGVCEHHHLRPLDEEGVAAIRRRAGNLLSDAGTPQDVWELTGGHPYLAEMVLCHAVDRGSVEAGWRACLAEFFVFYGHLRKLLAEDDLFSPLIQVAVGPEWSIRQGAVERLLAYGLIRPVDRGVDHGYRGWSAHFQEYLEKQSRETSSWELWSETERALRGLIEATFIRQYDDEWIERLAKKHSAIRTVVADWQDKRERERRQFGAQAAESLLSYAYPKELELLLFKEWELFQPRLGKDKTYWSQRFNLLSSFRNPTAHNREVPHFLVKEAGAYCEEILALIQSPVVT
ncbi:MAG: ATP-binding protein [Polyangiaceae bacterium]|nr:ATP-binding protein [Polyangiaceae bacterium]